jgi:hypothetical protein
MSIDEDVRNVKTDVQQVLRNQRVINRNLPGAGLYLMVLIGMIGAIRACEKLDDVKSKLAQQPQVVQNVIGGPEVEKFYIVDGQRAYVEIDGKSVETMVYGAER